MNKKILAILSFALLTIKGPAFGFQQQPISSIDDVMNFYSKYYDFNGSVLIVKNGETIFKKGYGYANYEFDIKTKPNTVYHIRSLTKGFTDVLIANLLAEKKLVLKDPIGIYLPELSGEIGKSVTLKHLMTHQSGIKSIDIDASSRLSKVDYLKQINHSKLLFKPGTSKRYHDFNYVLLGIIIERITQQTLATNFKEFIFTPLDMQNSGLADGESMVKNMATPYYLNQVDFGDDYHHVFPRVTEVGYAFGGITSTIEDLYKWLVASHTGRFKLSRISGITDNEQMRNDMPLVSEPKTIKIGETSKRVYIGDGGGSGFRSLYYYYPDNDVFIIMLSNTYYFKPPRSGGSLLYDAIPPLISQVLFNQTVQQPKIPIAKLLISSIEENKSIRDIISRYQTYKTKPDSYLVNVKQLNRAAYYCLESGKLDYALRLFELNQKEYPESWMVYDGLGEYFFRTKNSSKA
ncbi:MAG: beta-lactamase family protein, partial [Kangiellaceae bacterium]|nr:beta-lactamase family protein [Kangiellaceae bacterium]